MEGLPVQAVVWTQKGQWAETPSSLSLALEKAALTSLAFMKPPLADWSMKLEGWAPAAPDFLA
ncbi:MAG: hypothetical protein RI897_2979 [Verrucomicrobiota bacterium]